eukprot:scaffold26366_cov117-Cylindrotheca_fusiformis.AAC.11
MSKRALLTLRSFSNRRRIYNSFIARGFSSSDSADDSVDSQVEDESAGNNSIIFPWRHEEDPLPRMVPGSKEHATQGHLLSSVNTPIGNPTLNAVTTAYMFLDLPLWQLLFFGSFKQELTESISWAFTQGVNRLLSGLTKEPDTSKVDDAISFTMTVNKSNDNGEIAVNTDLESIMESKLLDLYATSSKNSDLVDGTEICLQSEPYSTELVSLYCIPYISRSNAKTNPSLLKFYRGMLEKRTAERQSDLARLRKEQLETGKMESTVIAQVLIWCKEKFYVKDTINGVLLQGQDTEEDRNIPHLVRMEMTVKTIKDPSFGRFVNKHGNWIITDIDDLVDGNLIL